MEIDYFLLRNQSWPIIDQHSNWFIFERNEILSTIAQITKIKLIVFQI